MNNLNPINLGDNRTAKKIVAGESHSCAILDNNNLVCWGENGANELGVESDQDNIKIGDAAGEMGNNLLATHLVSQNAIYMDLDIGFTCVISADGTLYCWGTNDYGQLGLGHTDTKGGALTQAADIRVDLGSNRRAKTVQAGSKHSCALLDNDEIKCWGRNNYGQLGLGNTENRGDDANEMGDHLAAVDLVPNMIDLAWTGYAFDTITYGDNAPAPNVPTGAPTGATICLFNDTIRCL